MTTVVFQPATNGSGATVPLIYRIDLALDLTSPALGWAATGLTAERRTLVMGSESVSVQLTPQSLISHPAGPTYYRVVAETDEASDPPVLIQVPNDGRTWNLYDLVVAASVPEADIVAGRLLTVSERAALDATGTPASASNPIATMADMIAGGAWVDAPADGALYARRNSAWDVVPSAAEVSSMLARIVALEANQLPVGAAGDILVHNGTTWVASTLGETA